ncbi:MAG TPA: hypothetical protein VGN72_01245 [Tepidisphaeraceae bacterium]|jgi:hypothetical protein|nr:hypothetical protein [Tepidisphaeraceae bacterium]
MARDAALVKGEHHYIFRWDSGGESAILEALVELVKNPELNFDRFDAAVVSHKVGQVLKEELKQYLPKS